MNLKIYIDGNFYPESEAKISVFDHGLLYGDGVFEGIRFYQGRVFRLEEHIARLWDSAKGIALEIPMSASELTAATLETIRQNDLHDGYIRLLITRAPVSLGLGPDSCRHPSIIHTPPPLPLSPPALYATALTIPTAPTHPPAPPT